METIKPDKRDNATGMAKPDDDEESNISEPISLGNKSPKLNFIPPQTKGSVAIKKFDAL